MGTSAAVKKAQSTMDYLMLTTVVLVVIIPLLFLSTGKLASIGEAQLTEGLKTLKSGIIQVDNIGYGAADRVLLNIPPGVESATVSGNTITFIINGQPVSVRGPSQLLGNLPTNEGFHYINLYNEGTYVIIYECGNNIVEGPEQCETNAATACSSNVCNPPGSKGECRCWCQPGSGQCGQTSCVQTGANTGYCGPCTSNAQCPPGQTCKLGVCGPDTCIPGNKQNCPNQIGVCKGSQEQCDPNGNWPSCTESTYLNNNPAYTPSEKPPVCSDGEDNDCDTEWDYDTQTGAPHGDDGCFIGVTNAQAVPANACPGEPNIIVTCTSTVANVNSIGAELDNIPNSCTDIGWSGNDVSFDCTMPQNPGTTVTATCFVDPAKSYVDPNYPLPATTTISVNPPSVCCSQYSSQGQTACENNNCEWCPQCQGTQSSGQSSSCVSIGGCSASYTCINNQCGATCQPGSCPAGSACDPNTCGCVASAQCGNGILESPEECDYDRSGPGGSPVVTAICNQQLYPNSYCDLTSCTCEDPSKQGWCGDGVFHPSVEECDYSAGLQGACTIPGEECSIGCECQPATNRCGNLGQTGPGGQCSFANPATCGGNWCNRQCMCESSSSGCGDGNKGASEECDGNAAPCTTMPGAPRHIASYCSPSCTCLYLIPPGPPPPPPPIPCGPDPSKGKRGCSGTCPPERPVCSYGQTACGCFPLPPPEF